MSATMLNLAVFLAISTLGFAVLLCLVSVISYARLRNPKFLMVGIAFAVLAIKGALATHRTAVLKEEGHLLGVALDFAVLALLYGSIALPARPVGPPETEGVTLAPESP